VASEAVMQLLEYNIDPDCTAFVLKHGAIAYTAIIHEKINETLMEWRKLVITYSLILLTFIGRLVYTIRESRVFESSINVFTGVQFVI
jgi:hypothetical protein